MDETSIKQTRNHYRARGYNNKPLRGASEQDRTRLGVLLQRRRGELGYGARGLQRFGRERGVNWKSITDIEKALRDGFMISTLDEYARAYEVTYDSLVAVGQGKADELTPAAPPYDPVADAGSGFQEASIEEARAGLGGVVDRVRYTGDPTLITRNGKPAALITRALHHHDREAIALIRQSPILNGPLEAGGARDIIEELLLILDGYLAADRTGATGA
jgi:prevent-host-death family protein